MHHLTKNITFMVAVIVALLSPGIVVLPAAFSAEPGVAPAGPPAEKGGGRGPHYVPDELLVRFHPGTPGAAMAATHAAAGSALMKVFESVDNLHLVKLRPGLDAKQARQHYLQHPHVRYAEPNWIVEAVQESSPNDTSFAQLWGLQNMGQSGGTMGADIDATNAWTVTTGSDQVVVVVIDTGIDYTHSDLANNIFQNSSDCDVNGVDDDGNGFIDDCYGIDVVHNNSNPMDDHNHGTHVAGTIGAIGNNALGVVGVNWYVKMIACKFLDAGGSGTIDGAISCLDYVKTMKSKGVNIIATNNSWGGDGFSQALFEAIEAQHQLGILFIAAAGNANSDNDRSGFYPASYYIPNLIAVAATTRTDARASFSNYGRHSVHLGAPGDQILSTTINNTYNTFSGTSMATPHVTGAAALVKAQFSGASWSEIKNLILAGSENTTAMANTIITGKRLNAYGAMTCRNSVVLARLRPTLPTVGGTVGVPITLDALHINCAVPNGPVNITVAPGGQVVTLQGTAGDGLYSGQWTPPAVGTYTLTFPNGDAVQVYVLQPYYYSVTSDSYRTITGTSLNFGDDTAAAITPAFPILFGGGSFNTLIVSSNGNLNFTTAFPDASNVSLTAPPASTVGTLVAPFWDDLYPVAGTAQNVFWAVTGTPGTRELVIEWRDVRHFSCNADTTVTVRFQVVFFEGSSNVMFNYADTAFGGPCTALDRGGSATIGVQTASNQATTFSLNSPSLSNGMALLWTLAAPPIPSLSVAPSTLNFGSIPVSTTSDLAFTVTNMGTGTLTGSASTASAGFSLVNDSSFDLGPGASQNVTVHFLPTATGTWNGNIAFTSNGGNASRTVTGIGVTPTSITVNSPSTGTVWANNSTGTITWSSSAITGNVRIDLSRDGGSSWSTLSASTPNNGSQTWKVKRPSTTQARIRICSLNAPSVCGVSNGNFTIQ